MIIRKLNCPSVAASGPGRSILGTAYWLDSKATNPRLPVQPQQDPVRSLTQCRNPLQRQPGLDSAAGRGRTRPSCCLRRKALLEGDGCTPWRGISGAKNGSQEQVPGSPFPPLGPKGQSITRSVDRVAQRPVFRAKNGRLMARRGCRRVVIQRRIRGLAWSDPVGDARNRVGGSVRKRGIKLLV